MQRYSGGAVTHQQFQRRMRALGCHNPHAAAARLGLDRSHVHRCWHGQRAIGAETFAALEAVEAAQPLAPLTPEMCRLLMTWPELPEPRSSFEAGIDWTPVVAELYDVGAAREGRLTAAGQRALAWIRER